MAWHAICRLSDNVRVSEGETVPSNAELAAKGLFKKAFAERPASGSTWDPVALEYVAPVVITVYSPADFMLRFTVEEDAAIRARIKADPPDAVIERFMGILQVSTTIRGDDPNVAAGLDYLVTAGAITRARREEILPWQPA